MNVRPSSDIKPRCVLCGAQEKDLILRNVAEYEGRRYSVKECRNCHLGFTEPKPDKEQLNELYRGYYTEKPEEYKDSIIKQGLKKALSRGANNRSGFIKYPANKMMDLLVQVCPPPVFGTGRILDVGCGFGRLLNLFKMQGWDVYGVEPGIQASEYAREQGHNIVTGEIADGNFPGDYFSCVVFSHSLEHISDPVSALNEAWRIMAQNGIVIIEVPNSSSVDAFYFKSAWLGWQLPFHLYHWSKDSLEMAIRKTGFTPERWKYKLPSLKDSRVNTRDFVERYQSQPPGHALSMSRRWLAGHLGINRPRYSHFITLYAKKLTRSGNR